MLIHEKTAVKIDPQVSNFVRESYSGTDRVREEVCGTDLSFALVPTGMISVLSSFILSLLQVIQSLTDSAQDWMSSSSLAKCSGLEDLCSCVHLQISGTMFCGA